VATTQATLERRSYGARTALEANRVVRKLPVIQTPSGEDAEAAQRSATSWLLSGAALNVALFMPFAMLASALAPALGAGRLLGALLPLSAFALASAAAGAITGRFGLRARRTTAPLAGALAGLVTAALATFTVRSAALLFVAALALAAVGAAAAALGAAYGRRKRPSSQ
jgi:hypothetical protein